MHRLTRTIRFYSCNKSFDTAQLIKSQTDIKNALRVYKDFAKHKPPTKWMMINFIRLADRLKDTTESLTLVDDALKHNIDDSFVLNSLLRLCIRYEKQEFISRLFSRIAELKMVKNIVVR
jgi:hypothetical protein